METSLLVVAVLISVAGMLYALHTIAQSNRHLVNTLRASQTEALGVALAQHTGLPPIMGAASRELLRDAPRQRAAEMSLQDLAKSQIPGLTGQYKPPLSGEAASSPGSFSITHGVDQ
jgi:hypothetical protein